MAGDLKAVAGSVASSIEGHPLVFGPPPHADAVPITKLSFATATTKFVAQCSRARNLVALRNVDFSTLGITVTNDTVVYDAVRLDPKSGEQEWIGRMGTREAITRDGLVLDAASIAYCPHEWIGGSGYVDLELVRRFPFPCLSAF